MIWHLASGIYIYISYRFSLYFLIRKFCRHV